MERNAGLMQKGLLLLNGFMILCFVVKDLRKFVIKAMVEFSVHEFVYYITCLQVNHSANLLTIVAVGSH